MSKSKVASIEPGSIAEEVGIEQGDLLLSINGEEINDIFDYRFYAANVNLLVEVCKKNGEVWEIEVEKDEYEDLGIEFENSMIDEAKSCSNKCIFCFIDQLPKGMRQTMYFKDDDSRLSFLMGNYVTLTNIDNKDIDRILKYRMSPINISVHTTNPGLRIFMLKNKFAGDVIDKIKKLVAGGITVNCQIVLCRGINDGDELEKTISDLSLLFSGVNSISVVPVGISKHRKNLYNLEPYDKISSKAVVNQVKIIQDRLLKANGSRVVYLADEFYIMAGIEIPDYEDYEDFPQIENGVGLIAQLRHEFYNYLNKLGNEVVGNMSLKRKVSIATGFSSFNYIKTFAEELENRFVNISVNVHEIKNVFFGENVTVTGLLTGQDIINQLKDKDLGTELLISRSMLKAGEELLLDDITVDMLEERLEVKVKVVENSGMDFIEKVLGIDV